MQQHWKFLKVVEKFKISISIDDVINSHSNESFEVWESSKNQQVISYKTLNLLKVIQNFATTP